MRKKENYLFKKIVNLKHYLSTNEFETLKKLGIERRNTKCTKLELSLIKLELEEFYDIRWLLFKTRTLEENVRLVYLKNKYNKIPNVKSIYEINVTREEFENLYEKFEILEKATELYYKLKLIEKKLAKKPSVKTNYNLLVMARNTDMETIERVKKELEKKRNNKN